MNKYDLLEAMSGIREEYIADAAAAPEQFAVTEAAAESAAQETGTGRPGSDQQAAAANPDSAAHAGAGAGGPSAAEKAGALRKKKKTALLHMHRWAAAAAALLCVAILLPVLLPGQGSALRGLPLVGDWFGRGALSTQKMEKADTVQAEEQAAEEEAAGLSGNGDLTAGEGVQTPLEASEDVETAGEEVPADAGAAEAAQEPAADVQKAGEGEQPASGEELESFAQADEAAAGQGGLSVQAYDAGDDGSHAAAGLTSGADPDVEGTPAAFAAAAVRTSAAGARAPEEVITRAAVDISRYESGVAEETGFESLRFTHHIITDAGSWFCMKVEACTTPAEGFEETVHFNYNAETGRFTGLRDLFPEGTDYITPISEEIRAQMRSRMEEDPDLEYWLDTAPETGQVFETISPRQDFYIDEDGILVICFDEMEAAPMYMGRLEFRIPEEVTQAAGMKIGK